MKIMINSKSDRPELEKINNVRKKFNATVEKFGTKSGWNFPIPTILLTTIKDENNIIVTDHVWFTVGKWCATLKPGDNFNFEARVKSYKKGYLGKREDIQMEKGYGVEISYRLNNPTKVEIIKK